MTGYFNIDKAVKHIKIIADNNRCNTCDKLLGLRLRYACGHIACKECIEESDECLTCFTSSQKFAPIIDTAQSQHVQNVSNLLTEFQETFNIDVNRRHRLSEKLKEEQEFFPECIQASITYYNRRTSSQIFTKKDKENITPFVIAGEQISSPEPLKMNTRINLVQKWLESNENIQRPVRKPFTDINVNSSFIASKENKNLNNSEQQHSKNFSIKKNKRNVNKNKYIESARQKKLGLRTLNQYEHFKAIKDKNSRTELKSNTILNVQENFQYCQTDKKCSNENLETIVIEDTPTQELDKDKEAWLAVLETEKNKLNVCKPSSSMDNYDKPIIQTLTIVPADVLNKRKNVSYYKKAPLYQSCQVNLNGCKDDFKEYQKLHSKDVFITVNTRSITTSIKITNNEYNTNFKNSISTQTVEANDATYKNLEISTIPIDDKQTNITSQDLFVKDTKLFAENSKILQKENVINSDLNNSSDLPYQVVNDSDSDSDIHCSGTFEVIAEVYTPNEKRDGVLSAITNENNYKRIRQACRRRTIDSNNSSEKENVEPNRPKKPRMGKKQDKKKEYL